MSDFWTAIASAAIPSAVGLAQGIFSNKAQKENLADDRAYKQQQSDLDFQRQKEMLLFKAGLGGGGGGGGGGGVFTGFTKPQKVQAIQAQNQIELESINNIIAAYQRALLSR